MNLVAILVAVLVTYHPSSGMMGRDSSRQASGGDSAPAQVEQEKSQPAATEPAPPVMETDPKQTESKPAEAPAVKADQPGPKKSSRSQPATAPNKRRARKKAMPSATADGEPRKVVIHRGGASEPVSQIVPGVTQEEAARQRESADQLLNAAESALKGLAGRSLNVGQEQLIVQIRQYMDGARSALKESDTQRAHTLALKAYLLSDDLAKH